jgi:DNA-binding GntR family transcriptional regulator
MTTAQGYRGIAGVLTAEVAGAAPGARIGSERELAGRFDCQRTTVRRALRLLEAQGLAFRRDRSGWYRTPARLDYDLTLGRPLADVAAAEGRTVRSELVDGGPDGADAPPGVRFAARRRRLLDGWRIVAEDLYLAPDVTDHLGGADFRRSVSELLRGAGVVVTAEELAVTAVAAPDWVADELYLAPSTAVLAIERIRRAGDRVIEHDREFWRTDAVRLRFVALPSPANLVYTS